MVEFKKEDLLKLKPVDRLKKLDEIEEEEKKEIEEVAELKKKAKEELKEVKPVVEVPPVTEIDISHLFGSESGIEGAVEGAPISVDFDVNYTPAVNLDGYRQIAGYAPKTDVNLTLFIDTTKYRPVGDIAMEISTASKSALTGLKKYGIH